MATTVVQHQTQSYPIGQHQPAVIQLQTVHHQTTTTTTSSNNAPVSIGYNKKAAFITGILQVCCGSLLVVLGVAALCIGSLYRSAWNIWGGICFYVVTGILGVVSRNQNRCMIISYMVMSIISAICAGGQLIYDSVAASVQSYYCYYDHFDAWGNYETQCQSNTGVVAVHSIAAVVGFMEMIVAIVASAYCCCGSCNSTPAQHTVFHYSQPYPGGHVTVVTPGSYPQGPAIINPSQSYGMGPYPPQYSAPPMGQMGESMSQTTGQPPGTHLVGSPSAPPVIEQRQYPTYSPPAYSYSQPSSVPVPLDAEPRPDSAFK